MHLYAFMSDVTVYVLFVLLFERRVRLYVSMPLCETNRLLHALRPLEMD